jgi:phage gp46-like protein
MQKDITLTLSESGYYDIEIESGELKTSEGLDTAIKLSLLIDKRADSSEIANAYDRGGNIIDELNDVDSFEIGSKLWLLRSERMTQNTINRAETYAKESLEWMIEDGLAKNIQANCLSSNGNLECNITLFKADGTKFNNSYRIWDKSTLV